MKTIVESYPNFAVDLSPRLILGLWHPVFLNAALEHVPSLRRIHIGASPTTARTYFWKDCDGFSMWFPSLVTQEGQNFIQHARKEGKDVFVWTVNRRDEMVEATRWGVKAILTDKTDLFQDLRKNMTGESNPPLTVKYAVLMISLLKRTTSPLVVNKLGSSFDGLHGDTIQFLNSLYKHGGLPRSKIVLVLHSRVHGAIMPSISMIRRRSLLMWKHRLKKRSNQLHLRLKKRQSQ
jgi:hypothetical protein